MINNNIKTVFPTLLKQHISAIRVPIAAKENNLHATEACFACYESSVYKLWEN